MSLRIIGGQWRSRRLERPDTSSTRPMPDRVKQSIFNILGSHFDTPGVLPPVRVADVFAGSGSLGFEALSRGASHCTFFESDRLALAALRENVTSLGADKVSTIVTSDAWRSAAREAAKGSFGLLFLDPPYRDSDDSGPDGPVLTFLRNAAEKADARTSSAAPLIVLPLIVMHHSAKTGYDSKYLSMPWTIVDERRFGTSAVTFFVAHS